MKILGIDLGSNSIGWAIRNTALTENQIEKYGVVTFNKGVGLGKSGEFSYAAERTKKRSARRLYQARKYRLWATLNHLIDEKFCPLSLEDLNKWRYYDKNEARKNRGSGRTYPVNNKEFEDWIKLDFDGDGKPDFSSPYQLRKHLAEERIDFSTEENRYKLGRALYHIAQRRGFKSSRKSGDVKEQHDNAVEEEVTLQYSEKKKNKVIADLFTQNPEAKTIGWLFALLENQKQRIRENIAKHAIRENYKDEIRFIFQETQKLGLDHPLYVKLVETGPNRNDGSIFFRRPLRSQKASVGKCTLEPDKYRAPISHPEFETFRAWSFLNNIKFKDPNNSIGDWEAMPLTLKQEIFNAKFMRKSKPYFPFQEIIDYVKDKGLNWQFNYKPKTTVTGCPVSSRLKDIFGEDFNKLAIPKVVATTGTKEYYDIEDIWHILFNFEDEEFVVNFALNKLQLSQEKAKQFLIAWNALPVGYGMLSLHAIKKINKFLLRGLIYTEAVLLAKIPDLIGQEIWNENENLFIEKIGEIVENNRKQKQILNIVNNLIAKHKNLDPREKFGVKDNSYLLQKTDFDDIEVVIEESLGKSRWAEMDQTEKDQIRATVADCYQGYFKTTGLKRRDFGNERFLEVPSGNLKYYKSDSGFYRLPRLIDSLGEFLQLNFNLDDKKVQKLYHPSEVAIYQQPEIAENGILNLGSPKTGSFKNPMAMRALYELRRIVNYLIDTKQIDNETRVVVEIARELNDSNKRWAIEAWQRQREAENQEFSEIIRCLLKEEKEVIADPENDVDVDKLRLFYEQSDEQTLPPVPTDDEEIGKKRKKQIKDEVVRWNGLGKNLIAKYRLWKEQGFRCIYTGRIIRLTDLFKEGVVDFEHTIPRSQSFDNSLANLTVCYQDYNRSIKKKQLPSQLANYNSDYTFPGQVGHCTAIRPRLRPWIEKIERIKQQIDFWITKSKKATDKSWKDEAIRQRHLWKMELDYWQNKVDRFQMSEVTSGFKKSQLVDTQLISKYAFHYLKTVFDKVEVQKGTVTASFRKILNIQSSDAQKDRTKHSHHAKDAVVLTLIPPFSKRDEILESYFMSLENRTKFGGYSPYRGFSTGLINRIDDEILVNNVVRDQTLTPSRRLIRARGKVQMVSGSSRPKIATGDNIRGQLHLDTFYGAIKPAKRGDLGNLLKDENGRFIQEEEERFVLRVPFTADFNSVEKIVDEGIKRQIMDQIAKAGSFKKAFEKGIYLLDKNGKPHGNPIRHIRVWSHVSDPLRIKKQTYITNKEGKDYKRYYWAANATNSYFAIYKSEDKLAKACKNLFETASEVTAKRAKSPFELFEPYLEIVKNKKKQKLPLKYVLKPGDKVLFLKPSEEPNTLSGKELSKRIYVYTNYEKDGRLNFKHHLEARTSIQEKYKDSEIDFDNPKPTLRFGFSKYEFWVDGYEFKIQMDGSIVWRKPNQ